MRYHFFLHYGWFFQNLGKETVRTFMHTTVVARRCEMSENMKTAVWCDLWHIVVTLTINLAPFIMFLWFIHDYRPLLKPVVKAADKHAGISQ